MFLAKSSFFPPKSYFYILANFHSPSQLDLTMDKLQLTGHALGRVFNFRSGCMHTMHLLPGVAIQPNLELKTRPKQLLGSLPLVIALPDLTLDLDSMRRVLYHCAASTSLVIKDYPNLKLESRFSNIFLFALSSIFSPKSNVSEQRFAQILFILHEQKLVK